MVHQDSLFTDSGVPLEREFRRVVVYCRASSMDQSCDVQERELLEYAGRAGHEVIGVFKDTGHGASKVNEGGAERDRIMALVETGEVDAMLVTELTRWGRSTRDLIDSLLELASKGVSLIALNGLSLDLYTAQGESTVQVIASLAEFERKLRRERISSGIPAARARGRTVGRPTGTRPTDKLIPQVVKLSGTDGMSQRAIAGELGISKTTVNAILKRHEQRHQ